MACSAHARSVLTFAIAAAAFVAFAGAPANAGLVGLWQFDGDYTDSSAEWNHGSPIEAGTTLVVGQAGFGQAVSFSGADTHVLVPHDTSLNITSAMTISAWLKPDGNSFEGIVAKSPSNGSATNHAGNYELRLDASQSMEFLYQKGGSNDTELNSGGAATTVATNPTWTHVAVTMDGTNVRYYMNGALVNTVAAVAGFGATNTNPLYIGSRADLFTDFHGQMDDVAIFNEVLTQPQIATISTGDFSAFDLAGPVPAANVTIEDVSSQLVGGGFSRLAGNTVDGLGRATTTPDGALGQAEGMWLTSGAGDTDPFITFDLGGIYELDSMVLFNYNETTAGLTVRGVGDVEIFVSNDNFVGDVRSLGIFSFDEATGDADNPGQLVTFNQDVARYVMLDILSNQRGSMYPDGLNNIDSNFVGLNEVEFFGNLIPEPSTWALFAVSLAIIPCWLRRRRRAAA